MSDEPMIADPNRIGWETGIFVRGKRDGEWDNLDIAELTRESLLRFLRCRGGSNPWAENTCLMIMGHEPEQAPPTTPKDPV